MKIVRIRFEMPYLQTTPNDLGLGDPSYNRQQLERLLSAPYQIIHEDDRVLLAGTTNAGGGEIFIIKGDEPFLTYYLKFNVERSEALGNAATNVVLWRRCAPGMERSTERIFYGVLLDKFDAVISPFNLTEAGERFWLDRMSESVHKGWSVGIMNGDCAHVYDSRQPLLEWVRSLNGWNDRDASERRCRLFISKMMTTRDGPGRLC